MCYTYVRATYYLYTLCTWYLYNNPPIPQGGGGGTVDPRWIIYMLATYDHTTYLLPYTQVVPVTLPSPHPPHRGCGGKVDPTSIIYMLAKCQLYRTAYIQDLDHGGQRGWLQGWAIYVYIYVYWSHGIPICFLDTHLFSLLPQLANEFCAKGHPTLAVEPPDSLVFHKPDITIIVYTHV